MATLGCVPQAQAQHRIGSHLNVLQRRSLTAERVEAHHAHAQFPVAADRGRRSEGHET
jgi:hypothetical protein